MRLVEIIINFSKANPLSITLIILAVTSVYVVIIKKINNKNNGVK